MTLRHSQEMVPVSMASFVNSEKTSQGRQHTAVAAAVVLKVYFNVKNTVSKVVSG